MNCGMIFKYNFSLNRSRSRNFSILAPAPAKRYGSLRLRLHKTVMKSLLTKK
jgi:hypothetical protein